MPKLKGAMRLYCRDCGKEMDYERDIDDAIPNNVKTISSQCPECNGGDFSEEIWAVWREAAEVKDKMAEFAALAKAIRV